MKIKSIFLFSFLFLFLNCKDDPVMPQLDISESVFGHISSTGTTLKTIITSNTSWIIDSNTPWCTPDKKQGTGNDILSILISPNKGQEKRTARISISAGGINKYVDITQENSPIEENGDIHYTLPVIFHILYDRQGTGNQNIEPGRLTEILENVNRLYSGENNSAGMNLELIPATTSPAGDSLIEWGIERIPWDSAAINCEIFMSDRNQTYKNLLWNPNKYINIMVYRFTDNRILGISTFPYTPQNHSLEGTETIPYPQISLDNLRYAHCISINASYIHEKSESGAVNQNDASITLAHELGHYLGLYHVFSESGPDMPCKDTDYCEDTPAYNRNTYENWLRGLENKDNFTYLTQRHDCSGREFISHNIMDYYYSYYDEFTENQRTRIRHILNYSPLIPRADSVASTRTSGGLLDLPVRIMK